MAARGAAARCCGLSTRRRRHCTEDGKRPVRPIDQDGLTLTGTGSGQATTLAGHRCRDSIAHRDREEQTCDKRHGEDGYECLGQVHLPATGAST